MKIKSKLKILRNIITDNISDYTENLSKWYKINYRNSILKYLITTKYAKKNVNFLFMIFFTTILRFHINILLCQIFRFNIIYIDFFIHIILSVILVLNTFHIFNFVFVFRDKFYRITRYVINNYSFDNYKRWKRNIIVCVSTYVIILLLMFEFNKYLLIVQIIQFLISFFIVDQIEKKTIESFFDNSAHINDEFKIYNDFYDVKAARDLNDNFYEITGSSLAKILSAKTKNE